MKQAMISLQGTAEFLANKYANPVNFVFVLGACNPGFYQWLLLLVVRNKLTNGYLYLLLRKKLEDKIIKKRALT